MCVNMCSAMCMHVCDQSTHNLVTTLPVANKFCTLRDSYKEAAEEGAPVAALFNLNGSLHITSEQNPKPSISSSIMTNYFSGSAHFQVIHNHYLKNALLLSTTLLLAGSESKINGHGGMETRIMEGKWNLLL